MDLQSLVLGVEAYVQQRLPQYIEELRALCAIDSDSYHKPGLDAMAARLAERMLAMESRPFGELRFLCVSNADKKE